MLARWFKLCDGGRGKKRWTNINMFIQIIIDCHYHYYYRYIISYFVNDLWFLANMTGSYHSHLPNAQAFGVIGSASPRRVTRTQAGPKPPLGLGVDRVWFNVGLLARKDLNPWADGISYVFFPWAICKPCHKILWFKWGFLFLSNRFPTLQSRSGASWNTPSTALPPKGSCRTAWPLVLPCNSRYCRLVGREWGCLMAEASFFSVSAKNSEIFSLHIGCILSQILERDWDMWWICELMMNMWLHLWLHFLLQNPTLMSFLVLKLDSEYWTQL